jgi:hypothetical protein
VACNPTHHPLEQQQDEIASPKATACVLSLLGADVDGPKEIEIMLN